MAFNAMANRISDSFEKTIQNGENIIITDNSPCAFTLKKYINQINGKDIAVLDPIEFLEEIILPNTEIKHKIDSLFIHTPCSVESQGITSKVLSIAEQIAKKVYTAPEPACCGFAGDLGFYVPELTEFASSSIKRAMVIYGSNKNYCSTSLTCEMGLNRTTGEVFQSLLSIADNCLK
jgi:D-lactate dehydrogenase